METMAHSGSQQVSISQYRDSLSNATFGSRKKIAVAKFVLCLFFFCQNILIILKIRKIVVRMNGEDVMQAVERE